MKYKNQYDWQPPSQEVIDKIQYLYDIGFGGGKKIAKEVGVSEHTIWMLRDKGVLRFYRSKNQMMSIAAGQRKLSQDTKNKISIARKKFLEENPDKHPYKMFSHKNGKSYAEKYFEEWLKKENFQYVSEFSVGRFSCDFLVNGVYDLEIDGQFHKNDLKKVETDKRKSDFLLAQGIKTIRVYWPDYNKYNAEERNIFLSDLKTILSNEKEIEMLSVRADEKLQERLKVCLCCGKKYEGNNKDFCSRQCKDLYNRMSIPEDFAECAIKMKVMELARKYKTNHSQIARWYERCGIERPKRKSSTKK